MKDTFVIHFCRNPKCNNCFIDEDLTNAQTNPPHWKYCPECVAKGFVNPDKPPKKKLSEAQQETLKNNQFTREKNPHKGIEKENRDGI